MSTRAAWEDPAAAEKPAAETPAGDGADAEQVRAQRTNSLTTKTNAMKAAKTSPSPVQPSILAEHSVPLGGATLFSVPEAPQLDDGAAGGSGSGVGVGSPHSAKADSPASHLERDMQRMGLAATYEPAEAGAAADGRRAEIPHEQQLARPGQSSESLGKPEHVLPAGIFTDIIGPDRTRLLADANLLGLFVTRPAPQGVKIQCRVYRRREGVEKLYPQYEMYLEEPGEGRTFLLSARKRKKSTTSNYVISSSRNMHAKGNDTVQGKVRANFIGTAFTVYDDGKNPFRRESSNPNLRQVGDDPAHQGGAKDDRKEVASIIYEPNLLGFKGPRKMTVILPGMKKTGTAIEIKPQAETETILERYKNQQDRELLVLHNKQPQWNEETRSFVLNFNGRVTVASVKNFQIVHDQDLDYIILQFGRTSEDVFTLDYQYPLTALQAFGIAMSSFAGKLACE